jgi:cytochrome c551/c552
MNRNTLLTIVFAALVPALIILSACGGNEGQGRDETPVTVEDMTKNQPEVHGTEIKESDITLTTPLNAQMVADGKATYGLKCQSCHKLTEEKLVGPGWKDVTKKRQPAWIMNMITNVDMMLEKDPEAQKLLEQCLVRMPNQNISKDDAREVLEFMRSNDGEK